MNPVARITLLSLVLGLSACAVQPPAPQSSEPIAPQPGMSEPSSPYKAPQRPVPAAPQTSAHFAPPPGGDSHWDAKLGVYVLDDQPDTFYRQRTYYRWDNGWSWSTARRGPWQDTDVNGVPPGLSRQIGH
ncbi:hypothetical protein QN382_00395 [Pseudomonas sp. 10B1]|uniref:hypothetical protein n=1 Tax=unclassified Pseudomonas TaxID=196821 RepID=UPI002AB33C4B|nr:MULTISPECIES: hypothetical protein [unclassified Pseudomonas]MDY7560699.1 hypothetical protein [Pseudomonas sp. AB6]MEA9979536.1 hypothetical protein [Pseudomonas sp. RTS4]MEA9996063.1 hypothetical protein [Pseudomonas sp. AA4]MEB0087386.1 hypothetical protein [Pseudomonas sp. RTI1]MEB0127958.1 hypothetical protein [Pseudomonas sp. CCC1.2]